MDNPITLQFLDHVAIRVKDLERSALWYENVLGLRRVQPEEWKPWPIFLLAGDSGIALFPEREGAYPVDHFAFRVDEASFAAAQDILSQKGIPYHVQDHTYFISMYFRDPDGHQVELTKKVREFGE
jgi:catechol 2,3-dioxygenase-like lactoylglutathione lyase family enzyme